MRHLTSLFLASSVLLAACGGDSDGHHHADDGHDHAAGPAAPEGAFPASLFASAPTGEPIGVGAMKSTAKAGDRVIVVGRIGGSEDPFLADRAMVTIADPSVKLCGEDDPNDDHCPTPWDFCCEPRDHLRKMSVTIVANAADGGPIQHSLRGQGGLKLGARVVVEGTVASVGPDGAAMINAERIIAQ
ncbi:MAG: hypothetical protein FJ254_04375 [Phycisphaerae bacterium]|nr:hypothetical protein [Phycisphaerae bacterium]